MWAYEKVDSIITSKGVVVLSYTSVCQSVRRRGRCGTFFLSIESAVRTLKHAEIFTLPFQMGILIRNRIILRCLRVQTKKNYLKRISRYVRGNGLIKKCPTFTMV